MNNKPRKPVTFKDQTALQCPECDNAYNALHHNPAPAVYVGNWYGHDGLGPYRGDSHSFAFECEQCGPLRWRLLLAQHKGSTVLCWIHE